MVRILTGADAGVTSPLVFPTEAELPLLAKLVYAKFPQLDTRRELKDAHDLAFRQTFWAVGRLGRLPALERKNTKHVTWWMGYTTDLLRDHHIDLDVNGQMFAAACLAHGDIFHSVTSRWPLEAEFGLTYPSAGTPAKDAWRWVLATGAFLPASPIYLPDYAPGRVSVNHAADTPIGRIG